MLGLAAAILSSGRIAAALEPKTFDYAGGGKWPQVEAPASRQADNPTLDRAERMLSSGQTSDAKKLLLDYAVNSRTARDRDRALFLLADVYRRDDDYLKAFYQYDELLDTYPESRLYSQSLEKQYDIADALLRGHKRRLFGLSILPADDEGIDMLFRLQERSPGSPLAERSLLRTAEYYFASSQFDLAGDAYAAYIRSYPRSPDVPRIRIREAFCSYAQFRGVNFDATHLIDARAQFEDIKVRYPQLATSSNVQQFIDSINETLARKMYLTADFYRRTDKPGGAAYTLRELAKTYPDSKEAKLVPKELTRLPAAALVEPARDRAKPIETTLPPAMPAGPPVPTTAPAAP